MFSGNAGVKNDLAGVLGNVQRDLDISRKRRIFCNRSLKMASAELIGFDMDYTLALYQQDRLEQLSIDLTLQKMCANHGYPASIRELHYDARLAIRGIMIDKEAGNVFKMDRHGHIGRAYHGKRLLSREDKATQYQKTRVRLSSTRYAWIDTLFGLPEVVMYMTLVDHFEALGQTLDFKKLFTDIRASIDEAHRDDTLKTIIKANITEYVIKDRDLPETLHRMRSSGKQLFLLTNSFWDYTNAVMKYLLDGERDAYPSWRNYFDFVIVGGGKPGFFTDRQPFQQVDPLTGKILEAKVTTLARDKVYHGGNSSDLEDFSNVRGDRVLYIGDHIYGDILKLKKSHNWRTAMVVQELENENLVSERLDAELRDLDLLDRRCRNLESEIDYQTTVLKELMRVSAETPANVRVALDEMILQAKQTLSSMRTRHGRIEEEVESLETSIDRGYNPFWGAAFREGHENSRFGDQVGEYADLYTSKVSNFLAYSPLRYFRAARPKMPHEV